MQPIRVFIVEGNAAVRRALATRLRADTRLEVVGIQSSLVAALPALLDLNPDVVLYGFNHQALHNGHLEATLTAVRQVSQRIPIIALAPFVDEAERQRLLEAGVAHYLLKQIDSPALIRQIKGAINFNPGAS